MSELTRRVAVAVVGAPLALWILWVGGAPLATLLASASAVAAWELFRLARERGANPLTGVGLVLAAALPLVVHAQHLYRMSIHPVAGLLVVLVAIAGALFLRGVDGHPLSAAAITIFGVLYTAGTLSCAYALRYFDYAVGETAGALVLMLPVLLTWASDIGAFFTGRLLKGPRLMPTVSPGKTISGAVGGVVFTVVVCALFVHWWLKPVAQLAFTPWGTVIFAVGVSAAGQIGDLAESLFKREAGVKDSGSILPGHGGALDRLDSLFFVLPVAYVLYWLLLIPVPAP